MKSVSFPERVGTYLDAAYPFLVVETHEEGRVLEIIRGVAKDRPDYLYGEWDLVTGLVIQEKDQEPKSVNGSSDALVMLAAVAKTASDVLDDKVKGKSGLFVLKDFHPVISEPTVWRTMRNMAGALKQSGVTVLMLSPRIDVPVELQKDVQHVDFSLPTAADLRNLFELFINESIRSKPENKKLKIEKAEIEAVVEAAVGMTWLEADNAFASAAILVKRQKDAYEFGPDYARVVFEEKIANLKLSALEYLPAKFGFDAVGGLNVIKDWSLQRRESFVNPEARELGLPFSKGAVLAGFKGCGKTVIAQAIAYEFGFPLFKFNIDRLFASKVGESEALTREVIRLIEGLGRIVVLLDEMEKYLNQGAVSGSGDSGTSSRMFGTLISWMATRTCPAFMLGTVNNMEAMPPETFRKGRFDETFWVDLPTPPERAAVFNALLRTKFKRTEMTVQQEDAIVQKTQDFSGAEIEAAIQEAMYVLLASKDRSDKALSSALIKVVTNMTPQAQLTPDLIKVQREKSKQGYKLANVEEPKAVTVAQSGTGRRRLA